MALSFLAVGSGIKPEMLGERQPYPIQRPRIVAALLMAYFVTHPAHVVGGDVVERLRVIPRFDGLGDRMHCIHARAGSEIRPEAPSTSPVV